MGADYTVVSRSSNADREDTVVTVHRVGRGGYARPWLYAQVEKIVDRTGPQASECHLTVRNLDADDEEAVRVCLQSSDGALSPAKLPGGSRIKAVDGDGACIFCGELARVVELNRAGTVKLIFHDDKSYLSRIPVWGTFLWDTHDDQEKLIPRLPLRWNPEGQGNCIEISESGGMSGLLPMMTHLSYAKATMEAVPYNKGDDPDNFTPTFWTPLRALRHLWYRMMAYTWDSAPAGFIHIPRPDLEKIDWPEASLAFSAPEMSKKLPDPGNRLNGLSFAEILTEILEATGSYGWRLNYLNDSTAKSVIEIFQRVPIQNADGSLFNTGVTGIPIEIQRGGIADDINTAFDFQSERDYSKTVTQLTVEGAPLELELSLQLTDGGATDTLERAWTDDDQKGFSDIIKGLGTGSDGAHALVDGQLMDGKDGRPCVFINTTEAVQLARAEYPLCWRAFKLKPGAALDALLKGGTGDPLTDFFEWLHHYDRPIAGEDQVQKILDKDGQETEERFQVRIEVDPARDGKNYHTAHANPGLRPTPRGIIFLDGLTDEQGDVDRIYNGSMLVDPENLQLRYIKLNAVLNHDARCRSIAALQSNVQGLGGLNVMDPNNITPELDPSWLDMGTGPSAYTLAAADVDHVDGFRRQIQVNSWPSAKASYGKDADNKDIPPPLNREYRTDQADLDALAARRFRDRAKVARVDSWRYIGIRPEFRAGVFIDTIETREGSPDVTRIVNAAVAEATFHVSGAQATEIKLEGF